MYLHLSELLLRSKSFAYALFPVHELPVISDKTTRQTIASLYNLQFYKEVALAELSKNQKKCTIMSDRLVVHDSLPSCARFSKTQIAQL